MKRKGATFQNDLFLLPFLFLSGANFPTVYVPATLAGDHAFLSGECDSESIYLRDGSTSYHLGFYHRQACVIREVLDTGNRKK